MTGFNNPIIGGGGALVYPAIHSPNFDQATQTGWSIDKNGNAYFYSVTVSGNVIVQGDGGTFVYDGTPELGNPPIASVSNTSIDPYGNAILPGVASYANPVTTGSLATQIDAGLWTIWYWTGTAWAIQVNTTISDQGTAAAAFTINMPDGTSITLGENEEYVSGPLNVLAPAGGLESWHYVGQGSNPGFGSGWSNAGSPYAQLAYKLVASPPDSVLIRGYVSNTTAMNTAPIFTLPAGYQPASEQIFGMTEDPLTAAVVKAMSITTAGVVAMSSGPAGAGTYEVDAVLYLDI